MRVIFVDVDTLRPDHLSVYGYSRPTTPNLGELAQRGVVFDNYYCSDSPCAPSRAALTTQRFGIMTGVIGNAGESVHLRSTRGMTPWVDNTQPVIPLLGEHLYHNNFYTASISCFPDRHQAYWWTGNLREWIKPTLSRGDDEDAANVNRVAFDWIRRHAQEDEWFLHIHYWDPHIPYVEPKEWFESAAASGPAPKWPDQNTIDRHQEIYGPHTAVDLYEDDGSWRLPAAKSPNPVTMPDAIKTRQDFEHLITGYDGAIMYWDYHFGQLVNLLTDLNLVESTAIIVSSDHGEAFGENGVYADHAMANEAVHHIPLIIYWPGITDHLDNSQRHSQTWAYNIDLGPTLCELLSIPVPRWWPGRSFAPALNGTRVDGWPYLVLSHGSYTYQRAVRTPHHLYIRTLHPGCFRIEPEQLYDMDRDPHLTENLVAHNSSIAQECRSHLEQWLGVYSAGPLSFGDPMQNRRYESPTEAFSAARYAERLRLTGREHLARELEMRSKEPWPPFYHGDEKETR